MENKLIQGSYSQKIKKGNLDNYNKMKEILEDKYGYSQGVYKSSSFLFENGKANSSAEKILTWYIKDTKVYEEKNYHRREFRSRSFSKSINLPEDADIDKITSEYANGILTISVPKLKSQTNKDDIVDIQIK
ncbi:Hsp20/alpha crystallin family protein [uncultured Ilyobacter sp.]|uniref:Hsp20/alpha crystallin family protein n=1 Tax=uncultured Ilyobacter sp. TaxID=544433 RepID=UPI0029F4FE71|nr:Hsp20/alpha crystallin family protein [uncultured Ilyobacter sp.]